MDLMYGIGLFFLVIFAVIRAVLDVIVKAVLFIRYLKRPIQMPLIKSEILLMPAVTLASQIRKGQLSCVDVVNAYNERIDNVNGILNAVVHRNVEKVVEEARKSDVVVSSHFMDESRLEKVKPFLGVPFTVKENFQVEGLKQTVGLTALRDNISVRNARVVELMKEAGAITLGVTNASQLCTSWECVNPVYGKTRNPYNTNKISGGTSGGEGSIIAAAGSVIGIGSDIAGSIRLPALFNGVFAHKPSKGIVSNDGMQPEVRGELNDFMVVGPICRYACDLLPVYKVLASGKIHKLKLDQPVDVTALKFYYMEDCGSSFLLSNVQQDMRNAQRKVIDYLRDKHGIKAEKIRLENLKFSLQIYLMLLCKNKISDTWYTDFLTGGRGRPNIYAEFLRYLVGKSPYVLSTILATWLDSLLMRFGKTKIQEYVNKRDILSVEFERLLRDDAVFLYPSHPTSAVHHGQPLAQFFNFSYAAIFNALGLPVTQCPLGLNSKGVPVGIQVIASLNNDHLTLAVAQDLEKAFGGWVWPVPRN